MAKDDPPRERRKRSQRVSSRLGVVTREDRVDEGSARPQNAESLRKARLEYLAHSPEERQKKKRYVREVVKKQPVTKRGSRIEAGHSDSISRKTTVDTPRKRRRRKSKKSESENEDEEEDSNEEDYVYGRPDTLERAQKDKTTQVSASTRQEDTTPRRTQTRRASTREVRPEQTPTLPRRPTEAPRRRDTYGADLGESPSTPPTSFPSISTRPPLRKSSTSIRGSIRTPLKRSASITSPRTEVSLAPSAAVSTDTKKTSIFSKFLRPALPTTEEEISCLTCGSDDIPKSKSVKLACDHRMCQSCIKRIFNMSVKDPAHMPPRCCTSKHIPLPKVEKLFSRDFQKIWIKKYDEYKTRNRIYCPARGCGEWIEPDHITSEHGRKVGKCKKCGMRVCATCNMKMHTSKDCPKDPATQQFAAIAEQKGWRKCFNCSAMVELKEGCNHMTCRCTAEFCMVCGLKWKSCDCPWFNYEAVDAHLGNPARYQAELDRRREQEQRDEMLARRMDVLGFDNDFALGNMAGHHLNANFIQQAREALTANYQVAEQAARGLLNGFVTGRENRLPGMPEPPNQTATLLRHGSRRHEETGIPPPPPATFEPDANTAGLNRHGPPRRRPPSNATLNAANANTIFFDPRPQTANERAQDRRIQDWANGIRPAMS